MRHPEELVILETVILEAKRRGIIISRIYFWEVGS